MFASTKRMGAIAIIACAVNTLMGIFILSYIDNLKLNFVQTFSIGAYMATVSAILLILGIAFFGLGQDLNISTDSTAAEISRLKKRVDRLENL